MQFAVPQFTDVEDRLIGPLTLKQFFVLLAAGAVVLFFWSILGPSIIFFLLAAPIAIAGVGIALARYNGRPVFTYLVPFVSFLSSNRVMVFKREVPIIAVSSTLKKQGQAAAPKPEDLEPAESRLKKLAYLLDRKSAEAKGILDEDEEDAIQAATAPKIDLGSIVRQTKAELGRPLSGLVSRKAAPPKPAPQPPAARPKPKKFDPSSILN